jgi:hypothetical protein
LLDKITANVRSFFTCTRADMLSGDIGRVLGIPASQAKFVDRAVLANIVASGVTIWGESLLPHIPLLPIRRFDVFKAFFGLFPTALLCAEVYPFHRRMTKYAMAGLKRSVHNCYFCYELRRAALDDEVAFFERRFGPNRTLSQLLALRHEYRDSFAFVAGCLPTLVRLHWRTAFDNQFPREPLNPNYPNSFSLPDPAGPR